MRASRVVKRSGMWPLLGKRLPLLVYYMQMILGRKLIVYYIKKGSLLNKGWDNAIPSFPLFFIIEGRVKYPFPLLESAFVHPKNAQEVCILPPKIYKFYSNNKKSPFPL